MAHSARRAGTRTVGSGHLALTQMPEQFVAEVDGNRTRRTGIARPNRFEGGGAHQVPRHLPVVPRTLPAYSGGRVAEPADPLVSVGS